MPTARRRSRVQTLTSTDIAAYMRFRAQIFTLTDICPRTIIMENPFPYSDTNRRFYTYDYYMRRQTHSVQIVMDKELPGDYVDTTTPWDDHITGTITSMTIKLSGIAAAECDIVGTGASA